MVFRQNIEVKKGVEDFRLRGLTSYMDRAINVVLVDGLSTLTPPHYKRIAASAVQSPTPARLMVLAAVSSCSYLRLEPGKGGCPTKHKHHIRVGKSSTSR